MVSTPESLIKDSFSNSVLAANLLNRLVLIAREAGEKILSIYNLPVSSWELEFKKDHSPFTLADRFSNEVICYGLRNLDQSIPIISEENKAVPYETRKDYEYFWLVDPLDGTKEFIKRNGEFTVNIALVHRTEVVLGVVGIPCLDKIYFAMKNEGAFRIVTDKPAERIRAAVFSLKDQGLKIAISRSHMNLETWKFIDDFRDTETITAGSSLKFMLIAEGSAHLYPRFGPTMEWDTAASQIIVEEAGGGVFIADSSSPLYYNKQEMRNPGFVAYGNNIDLLKSNN